MKSILLTILIYAALFSSCSNGDGGPYHGDFITTYPRKDKPITKGQALVVVALFSGIAYVFKRVNDRMQSKVA